MKYYTMLKEPNRAFIAQVIQITKTQVNLNDELDKTPIQTSLSKSFWKYEIGTKILSVGRMEK